MTGGSTGGVEDHDLVKTSLSRVESFLQHCSQHRLWGAFSFTEPMFKVGKVERE